MRISSQYLSSSDKGVIYVTAGDEHYTQAALTSLASLRRFDDLPATLYTDALLEGVDYSAFEAVVITEFDMQNFWATRMRALLHSPYKKTLYLDSDSYVVDGIGDLFTLLEQFDFAVCHGGKRLARHYKAQADDAINREIPYAFAPINGGVQALRKNARSRSFLRRLIRRYQDKAYYDDQVSIRELLWERPGSLRFCHLPREYRVGALEVMELWERGIHESMPKIYFYTQFNREQAAAETCQRADAIADRLRERQRKYRGDLHNDT